MTQTDTIQIDIVSDVMCPWCYIGKRRMEKALEMTPDVSVTTHWRPFQLDGTLPAEGKDRGAYLRDKFGGEDQARRIYSRIEEAGNLDGIPFAFDKIIKSPNTLDCHRLIRWAQTDEQQNALVEELFRLYFIDGADLTDPETLIEAANMAGMDPAQIKKLLASDHDKDETKEEIQVAQQMGITGVPCFIIDGRYALMGAESPEAIAQAIKKAISDKSAR